jgi:MFS family permease
MAVPWGTLSDHIGRKPIIISGLICTMILSILLGMSQTLGMVLVSRALIGLMNGNVGIIRTMVAEIVPERELQPRAFSIMPMVWTIGSIFGPAFGGALARPAEKHPALFGDSVFLRRFPFALPNLLSAVFFIVSIITGILFLQETLETKKERYDPGLALGQALTGSCVSRKRQAGSKDLDEEQTLLLPGKTKNNNKETQPVKRPSWSQVFTPQSNIVLVCYTLMSGLGMAFDSVFPVFLHYPVQDLYDNPDVKLPFKFASGFGIGQFFFFSRYYQHSTNTRPDAQTIGLYYTVIGIAGMMIQFLCFPPLAQRYGVLNCFRAAAIAMPIIFFLTPFTALVPESLRLAAVLLLMLAKLGATVFGIPCCTILLTNSAASMTVLGTLNGVGTSVSALGRAAGPALIGAAFSWGVKRGSVVVPWWLLGILGAFAVIPSYWVVEQEGPHRGKSLEEVVDQDEDVGPQAPGYGGVDSANGAGTTTK